MKIEKWFKEQNKTELSKLSFKTRPMLYQYVAGDTQVPLDVAKIWMKLSGLTMEDIDAPYIKKFKEDRTNG